MRIGQVFTYRGRFPWRCFLCPSRVLPGESAFHLWAGTVLLLGHEPGTCPVGRPGIDPGTHTS